MPAKKKPTGTDADLSLASLSRLFVDEDAAREFLEKRRWPDGPVCPHCQTVEPYTLTPRPGSKSPVRKGVYKCRGCHRQFTVRIGSIFEESRLPLSKWLMAIHLMTSSKKGVSSHQIARELGVTVKTAWFLTHRLREAMREGPLADMLSGAVEVDETYVGGKPRRKGTSKPGRGTNKQPVMVLVERDGRAVAKPIDRVDGATLRGEVRRSVGEEAVVVTDEFASYRGVGEGFVGGHLAVNHGEKEYMRLDEETEFPVHVNTAESFSAILKRSHYGIHHSMSKKHLHRYVNERAFVWNLRRLTDGERIAVVVRGAEGKRLRYR